MDYIKKNKLSVFIMAIFTLVVVLGVVVYKMFFVGGANTAVYGDRLDGIEDVPITSKEKKNLIATLKEKTEVVEVKTTLHGKIFNIIITVQDNLAKDKAKKVGESTLASLSNEQLDFYDIQVWLKKTDEKQNDFPIVGYKQSTQKTITWSKDRQVSEVE